MQKSFFAVLLRGIEKYIPKKTKKMTTKLLHYTANPKAREAASPSPSDCHRSIMIEDPDTLGADFDSTNTLCNNANRSCKHDRVASVRRGLMISEILEINSIQFGGCCP